MSESRSVVSDSLWPHGLYSPWSSPGQNTGVGSLSLLQGIFPTQGSTPGLLPCRQILYQLNHKGSPRTLEWVAYPFSRGSSRLRNQTGVSCIAGGFFTNWAMREALSLLVLTYLMIFFDNNVFLNFWTEGLDFIAASICQSFILVSEEILPLFWVYKNTHLYHLLNVLMLVFHICLWSLWNWLLFYMWVGIHIFPSSSPSLPWTITWLSSICGTVILLPVTWNTTSVSRI